MKALAIAAMLGFTWTAAACGGSGDSGSGGGSTHSGGDCTSVCQDAQSRDCTSVHGDCGTFCAAVANVSEEGGCTSEHDAYESCLGDGDVCTGDSRCATAKRALTDCAGAYCAGHASDPDCQTVVSQL